MSHDFPGFHWLGKACIYLHHFCEKYNIYKVFLRENVVGNGTTQTRQCIAAEKIFDRKLYRVYLALLFQGICINQFLVHIKQTHTFHSWVIQPYVGPEIADIDGNILMTLNIPKIFALKELDWRQQYGNKKTTFLSHRQKCAENICKTCEIGLSFQNS